MLAYSAWKRITEVITVYQGRKTIYRTLIRVPAQKLLARTVERLRTLRRDNACDI